MYSSVIGNRIGSQKHVFAFIYMDNNWCATGIVIADSINIFFTEKRILKDLLILDCSPIRIMLMVSSDKTSWIPNSNFCSAELGLPRHWLLLSSNSCLTAFSSFYSFKINFLFSSTTLRNDFNSSITLLNCDLIWNRISCCKWPNTNKETNPVLNRYHFIPLRILPN